MNAARWDASNDPWDMLDWLAYDCSVRQQGLWALACLCRVQDLIPSNCRELIAEIERSLERADHFVGQIDRSKWESVLGLPFGSKPHIITALSWLTWPGFCKSAVGAVADAVAEHETGFTGRANWPPQFREVWRREQAIHADLLREVRGNPFRPVNFDPAWRTTDVTLLAQRIYDMRDFGALPILADALQDAGCTHDALLAHLRDPKQVHFRGCWALDLALARL